MSRGERKAMIVPGRPGLSLSRQCRLLSISRASFYYAPRGESPENLALMRRIDELFLKYPFYGSRQMARQLQRDSAIMPQLFTRANLTFHRANLVKDWSRIVTRSCGQDKDC